MSYIPFALELFYRGGTTNYFIKFEQRKPEEGGGFKMIGTTDIVDAYSPISVFIESDQYYRLSSVTQSPTSVKIIDTDITRVQQLGSYPLNHYLKLEKGTGVFKVLEPQAGGSGGTEKASHAYGTLFRIHSGQIQIVKVQALHSFTMNLGDKQINKSL